MTILVYIRCSTENQPNSMKMQQNAIEQAILNSNPDFIGKSYICSEICRGTENDILSKITKKTKGVIIYDISRFSRSLERGLIVLDNLLARKIWVYSVSENIEVRNHNSEEYNKFASYLEAAENESKIISRRIKDTKISLFERGMYIGGNIPYGLDLHEYNGKKYYVVNEQEIRIVNLVSLLLSDFYWKDDVDNAIYAIIREFPENFIIYDGEDPATGKEFGNRPMKISHITLLLNNYNIKNRNGGNFTCTAIKNMRSPRDLRNWVKYDFTNDLSYKLDKIVF